MLLAQKHFILYLVVVLATSTLTSCAVGDLQETPPAEVVLSNEFVEIHVDKEKGYFYLKTTGGDPQITTDSNKRLLFYGKLSTGVMEASSRAFIQIDGVVYRYGESTGVFEDKPQLQGDAIVSRWLVEGVSVGQSFRLVEGSDTGNPDTIMVEYTISGQEGDERNVGLKMFLDTLLGDNDGAPFSLADKGTITREIAFEQSDIPDFWYATDSLSNPTVRAQGTLRGDDLTTPGRIVFADLGNLSLKEWDYDPRPDFTIKDSAVLLYWPAAPLKDEPRRIATYYGIYGLSERSEIFALQLSVPEKAYFGQDFIISSSIRNLADFTVPAVKAGLSFTKDGNPLDQVVLLGEQGGEESIGDMLPGENKEILWKLSSQERLDGIIQVALRLESGEIKIEGGLSIGSASSRVIKELRLFGKNALSVVVSSANAPRVIRVDDETVGRSFNLSATILNDGAFKAIDVQAILLIHGKGDDLLLIVDDPVKPLGEIDIGGAKKVVWKVNYPAKIGERVEGELSYSIVVVASQENADALLPVGRSIRSGKIRVSSGGILADIKRVNQEIKGIVSLLERESDPETRARYLKRLRELRARIEGFRDIVEKEEDQ